MSDNAQPAPTGAPWTRLIHEDVPNPLNLQEFGKFKFYYVENGPIMAHLDMLMNKGSVEYKRLRLRMAGMSEDEGIRVKLLRALYTCIYPEQETYTDAHLISIESAETTEKVNALSDAQVHSVFSEFLGIEDKPNKAKPLDSVDVVIYICHDQSKVEEVKEQIATFKQIAEFNNIPAVFIRDFYLGVEDEKNEGMQRPLRDSAEWIQATNQIHQGVLRDVIQAILDEKRAEGVVLNPDLADAMDEVQADSTEEAINESVDGDHEE